jgi:Cys-rich repeat protein
VCLQNSDCPAPTPICHADQCVQCFKAKDCPAGQVCLAGACH